MFTQSLGLQPSGWNYQGKLAINQSWSLVTDLLPFRRVGGRAEKRKGLATAQPRGNSSAPRSRKVTWEVALRWHWGEGSRGWHFHGTEVMRQS